MTEAGDRFLFLESCRRLLFANPFKKQHFEDHIRANRVFINARDEEGSNLLMSVAKTAHLQALRMLFDFHREELKKQRQSVETLEGEETEQMGTMTNAVRELGFHTREDFKEQRDSMDSSKMSVQDFYYETEDKSEKEVDYYPLDFKLKDKQGLSAIFHAVKAANFLFLRTFIVECPEPLEVKEASWNGMGLIEYSFVHGKGYVDKLKGIETLIKHGCEVFQLFANSSTLFDQFLKLVADHERGVRQSIDFFKPRNEKDLRRKAKLKAVMRKQKQIALQTFKLIIQAIQGGVRGLICSTEENDNVLHKCVLYNQPNVLKYLLKKLQQHPTLLRVRLLAINSRGLNPLFLCCFPAFPTLNNVSRYDCAKLLLDYGAPIDTPHPRDRSLTPLAFCVRAGANSEVQQRVACLLIERGANLHKLALRGRSMLKMIMQRNLHLIIQTILEKKLIEVNEMMPHSHCTPLMAVSDSAFWLLSTKNLPTLMKAHVKSMQLLVSYGASPKTVIHHHLLFQTNDNSSEMFLISRYIIKKLVEMCKDLNEPDPPRMGLLISCVSVGEYNCFRFLMKHGCSLSQRFNLKLCGNAKVHRPASYESSKEKYETYEIQGSFTTACDMCSRKLSKQGDRLFRCSVKSCDFDLCESCSFFYSSPFAKEGGEMTGVNALDIAKRKANPLFTNCAFFCTKRSVGVELINEKLFDLVDTFQHLQLSEAPLVNLLDDSKLLRIGIKDQLTRTRLLERFAVSAR